MTASERIRLGACLSLTGRFARFGRQAADALRVWRDMTGAELVIEDDKSDPRTLERLFPGVADRSDVLLGPYATNLMRVAGTVGADKGRLLWNHGGSGDDIESAHPGHVVSTLTPTSRYAVPFLRHLREAGTTRLVVARGKGSFGRQVIAGATRCAAELGIGVAEIASDHEPVGSWTLFSAGTFEDDVANVKRAQLMRNPPSTICSIAAGVREFPDVVAEAHGVLGIAQWFPGAGASPALGPTERDFLASYAGVPDYPAVQAFAAAVLAAHCAKLAGTVERRAMWDAAASLTTSTFFGAFRIDPSTGSQVDHQTVLLRWTESGLTAVR